jgi:hypothetical protein
MMNITEVHILMRQLLSRIYDYTQSNFSCVQMGTDFRLVLHDRGLSTAVGDGGFAPTFAEERKML